LYNIGNIELDRFNKLYDNRLKHLQFETDQVSRQINMTIKEKEMSDQKIKIMEHEALQLHKTVEDKNRNFNELNSQLNSQLNE
jgi:chromosome segregation ATPase